MNAAIRLIPYCAVGLSLKAVGATPTTRYFYRILSNLVSGRRQRSGRMPLHYISRLVRDLKIIDRHGILQAGDHLLEIGSGWCHWEAIKLRLFFDVRCTLFDVWDNRQFAAMLSYVRQLDRALSNGLLAGDRRVQRARALIAAILRANSFEELYYLLNFEYLLDAGGRCTPVSSRSFKLVISTATLEHIAVKDVPGAIHNLSRLVAPGGWVIHRWNLDDHISHYTGNSQKEYLRFSPAAWSLIGDNQVQRINSNRIPRSEWLRLFRESGLSVVQDDSVFLRSDQIPQPHKQFNTWSNHDRRCIRMSLLMQRTNGMS